MRPARLAALHQRFTPAPLALAAALSISLTAGHAPLAHAQNSASAAAAPIAINIPAQPLGQALNELARQANLQMSFPASLVAEKTAPSVSGLLTTRQALDSLLRESGLVAALEGATVVVRQAPGQQRGEALLPTVTVTADRSSYSAVGPDFGYVPKRSRAATKSDTPLIETPQAITVVTRDEIRDRGNANVTDALRNVAGVTIGQNGRRDRDDYSLRGFTQSNFVLRDGLRQFNFQFMASEPWGLERIEVLKGPSSLLYGQLAPGGTINLVSKRPTNEAIREAEVSLGTNNTGRLGLDLGGGAGPDSDWSWRLNALQSAGEDDIDFVKRKRTYIAPALKWQPSTSTSLTLLGLYQESTSNRPAGLPARGTVLPNINGKIPLNRNVGDRAFEGDGQVFKQSQLGYLFEHRFADGLEFRQNTRIASNKIDANNIFLGSLQANQRIVNRSVSVFDQNIDTVTVDNQLQKSFSTGRFAHTLTVGLDYFSADQKLLGFGGTISPLDLFNPVYGTPVTRGSANFGQDAKVTQYGLYIQDQIKFAERWVVLGGLRHDKAKTDSLDTLTNTFTGIDSSKTTGRLGLLYLAPNGVAPYVSYATSFVPLSGSTFGGTPFEPETGEQVELGVKYEPAGTDFTFTAALYDLRRQNLLTTDLTNPGFSIQAGEHRHRGLELEAKGEVARGLTVAASYGYIDGEVTRDNSGLQGTRSTGAPRHTASLWAKYRLQNPDLRGWSVGAGAYYSGSAVIDARNSLIVPSYLTLDAAVFYQADQWRFAVNFKNLADKEYISSCFGLNGCFPGERRSISATASYSF